MIVKMSKVEIVGPKTLLADVISLLQKNGVLHIEPEKKGFVEKVDENYINSLILDENCFKEKLFLEEVRGMIDELNTYLPSVSLRESYLNPSFIIDTITENLKKHLSLVREINLKKEKLERELQELEGINILLNTAKSMIEEGVEKKDLDFTGFVVKDDVAVTYLNTLLNDILKNTPRIKTAALPDGSIMVVVAFDKTFSETIKGLIKEKKITDYAFPDYLEELSLDDKVKCIEKKINENHTALTEVEQQLEKFAYRWLPIYNQTRTWIEEKLSLIKAMTATFETKMCFFIYGWMPTGELKKIEKKLDAAFEGKVIIQEREIREEDLERVPVFLKNPSYFRPFELLVRFLPLPKYTTYDPTPYIGIFFPLFFGMILGDLGYALVLFVFYIFLSKKGDNNQITKDISKILLICALYSAIFGVLYGEFFGDLPQSIFGIHPLWVERRESILPVLYFALSVGFVHIILGLFLGAVTAYKRHFKRELAFKLLNIAFILCVLIVVMAVSGVLPFIIAKPFILALIIISPFLLFSGGLLAPLEVIKSIGNIISYARIMAIGLTSVLIAYVANRMAGMIGNIVVGVIVAIFLHFINIILGVFSPTVHSLRLHYVEFFSKFLEQGGRRYKPLNSKNSNT